MSYKIFIAPLSEDGNLITVMANSVTDASMMIDAEFSKIDGLVMTHSTADYFTVDSLKEAKAYKIEGSYALGHCGMTIVEFFEDIER